MILNWQGKEVPAYISITMNDINYLLREVFNRTYDFTKGVSCVTEDVKPYYCKNPRSLTNYLNELCLRGKIKRGHYIIERK